MTRRKELSAPCGSRTPLVPNPGVRARARVSVRACVRACGHACVWACVRTCVYTCLLAPRLHECVRASARHKGMHTRRWLVVGAEQPES
jgi:hypothetical protein